MSTTAGRVRVRLPKSFQQTEIGLLPADWEIKQIGELCSVVRGGSPRPAGDPRYFDGDFTPWLTVASLTNIPSSQLFVTETASMLTRAGVQFSRQLDAGTIVIVNSGARTLGVTKILAITCCANDGIAALINQTLGDKRFLCHFLNSQIARLRRLVAAGNDQLNLNTTRIAAIKVPFPPLIEQRAISDSIDDADALIVALEQLIAKKRIIKQGAIQELLSGKRRLSGFKGEWKNKRLGADATLKGRIGWQGLTSDEYLDSGDYYLVTGTEFANGRVNWSECHFVDQFRYGQDRNIQLRVSDVLVTKDGTIGKVALIDELPSPATLNSGVFVVRPREAAFDPRFFYYVMQSQAFVEFLNRLSAGSTINHLYQKDIVYFSFRAPPTLAEQSAIARVILDMDAEIDALDSKLCKTRAVKQGMMQELLTGRTRLV